MAISDVLRKALRKLSLSHVNGDMSNAGKSKTQKLSDSDEYARDYIAHTHSHTLNTYSPVSGETTHKQTFKFPCSSKRTKEKAYGDTVGKEEVNVVDSARARLEGVRKKEREKKKMEKGKKRQNVKEARPRRRRPPHCRMQSLESYSFGSSTSRGRDGEDATSEESDISPGTTRNNSKSNRTQMTDERMAVIEQNDDECQRAQVEKAQLSGAELRRLML